MSSRPLPDEPLFTPKEAAAKLNMSVKTLMSHVKEGRLRFINIGTQTRKVHRFTPYNLQTFIENQKIRETPKCQSISAPALKPIAMTSGLEANDFMAILKSEQNAKPKPLN